MRRRGGGELSLSGCSLHFTSLNVHASSRLGRVRGVFRSFHWLRILTSTAAFLAVVIFGDGRTWHVWGRWPGAQTWEPHASERHVLGFFGGIDHRWFQEIVWMRLEIESWPSDEGWMEDGHRVGQILFRFCFVFFAYSVSIWSDYEAPLSDLIRFCYK